MSYFTHFKFHIPDFIKTGDRTPYTMTGQRDSGLLTLDFIYRLPFPAEVQQALDDKWHVANAGHLR
jgi:hypothetical protein